MQTKRLIAAGPLYARLPRGPHRLGRRAVLLNQRARLHGAMIEAVAEAGYEATSVKRVIALAGVSRRAFYEQFANRQDCFLATFDAIAAHAFSRARSACLAADGSRDRRLRAAFGALARDAAAHPAAATLVAVEIETCGLAGVARLRRVGASCEPALARALWREPAPVPAPLVRGVVGGVHAIIAAHLTLEGARPRSSLPDALLAWTLPFAAGLAPSQAAQMAREAAAVLREASAAPVSRAPASPRHAPEHRALQRAALRLAALGEFRDVAPARIADEARVPVESFHASFADPDACFATGLEELACELLESVEEPLASADSWPACVRDAVGALLAHLVDQPLSAHTISRGAFSVGAPAVRRNRALARAIAARLLRDAPADCAPALIDGAAGALWHTIGCQVAGGRAQLLPALRDYLTYLLITPALGAESAAELGASRALD
ncbi:MAG TPA: helix-turn-helix domain-containing protein [Solirubrobacteraceae bacterium]|nr:helix-turn-helix domain-containing protein [Solirubrobacteraceae bacterium]